MKDKGVLEMKDGREKDMGGGYYSLQGSSGFPVHAQQQQQQLLQGQYNQSVQSMQGQNSPLHSGYDEVHG